ncbi:hypothetical protein I551_8628, partial [Mycobacterium ulcerans str. Harvey]
RLDEQNRLQRYEEAFADQDAPFAFVDLDAMWSNAGQMLSRAGDKPIRVASKSLRCRPLQREILDSNPRFEGLMTFTLPRPSGWRTGLRQPVACLSDNRSHRLRALGELTAENPAGADRHGR